MIDSGERGVGSSEILTQRPSLLLKTVVGLDGLDGLA